MNRSVGDVKVIEEAVQKKIHKQESKKKQLADLDWLSKRLDCLNSQRSSLEESLKITRAEIKEIKPTIRLLTEELYAKKLAAIEKEKKQALNQLK